MDRPKIGPCTPWVTANEIAALTTVANAAGTIDSADLITLCGNAAMAASEVLFERSGQMFTGLCGPITIRPVSRPPDADQRSFGARISPLGWFASWGMASSYGASIPAIVAGYGPAAPPTVKLPYPAREILLVKIDGEVIPGPYDPATQTGEWELRSNTDLVRIRPTAGFSPTDRYGWPVTQIADLPDTEEGTFSVTLTFGIDPPVSGRNAALKLGEYLALRVLGDAGTLAYPDRVTAITRQGVNQQVTSVIDLLNRGAVGIYEVDLFLKTVNPNGIRRRAAVWTPDIGRSRQQSTVTMPD